MNVGLYFGTFNPIHIGHLKIANYMATKTDLDEVWLVVSPHNPLKDKAEMLDEKVRLELVKLAITNNNKLKVTDIEFSLPHPSYTYDTLLCLKNKYPTMTFVLIMGQDNLSSFDKWKKNKEIISNHKIYVYPRNKNNNTSSHHQFFNHTNVEFVQAPLYDISSSFIRNQINKGKDVSTLLTQKVHNKILEEKYYVNN